MKAIEHYDVAKGFHFISYAAWWVRQSILKALSEDSRMIRLPWNRANELLHIERRRQEMLCESGGSPALARIAEELGLEQGHVNRLLNLAQGTPFPGLPGEGSA